MAYIGKQPVIGNFVKLDAISVVNGQASYTMQNGGANFTAYANVNQFLVSLNGILQSPTTSFTVSSSTITFASNLQTGDVIDFIIVLGNTLDVGVPSDNTVSLAKLTATGTKDATTFLRGDNTFAEAGGGIEEIDNWRLTADTTTNGFITSNWERNDSNDFSYLGTGMTESSGVFSFPSTGKYLIIAHGDHQLNNNTSGSFNIYSTVDNSTYTFRTSGATETSHSSSFTSSDAIYVMNVTNTSNDKVKFQTSGYSGGGQTLRGNTDQNETHVLFIKLA
jgi:hypothetical protein